MDTSSTPFFKKWRCVTPDGTPPTKPGLRKGDGLPASTEHFSSLHMTFQQKSCSGDCTAPRWWRFSCLWRGLFVPVLSMPLEKTICSCPSVHLQSSRKEVSLWTAVHCHVFIIPYEARHWLGRYNQLLGHDLLFPELILVNLLLHCFDSSLSPQTFQASWLSPVFNPPEFVLTFNCLIDENSQNFQWF